MEVINFVIGPVNDFVWGPFMLVALLGVGLFLTFRLNFLTFRKIPSAFKLMLSGRKKGAGHEGELSPFNALMTAMAATIGTGNMAGVAVAIYLGGPGAVFWMWCTSLLGMATTFTEVTLSIKYREVTPNGDYVGGPMYYIKNGLGKGWKWMAFFFAVCGAVACFGIGNMTQVNSIASALQNSFEIPTYVSGAVLFIFTGLILVGGIQRIGSFAGNVVPFMAVLYIICSIACMALNIEYVPAVFTMIFTEAFNPTSAAAGTASGLLLMSMRYGIARGAFSNEAGMGSAPIAHATAATNNPVRQGIIGMIGVFIDTIIVCSMTAIVVLIAGIWSNTYLVDEAKMGKYIDQEIVRAKVELVTNGAANTDNIASLFTSPKDLGDKDIVPGSLILAFNGMKNRGGVTEAFKAAKNPDGTIDSAKTAAALAAHGIPDPGFMAQYSAGNLKRALEAAKDKLVVNGKLSSSAVVAAITAVQNTESREDDVIVSKSGAALTANSYALCLPGTAGHYVVAISLSLFAFTTIIGWCVYGERCMAYLFGYKIIKPFRILFTCVVPVGAILSLDTVWNVSDTFNGMMMIPNLIAVTLLSGIAAKLAKDYFEKGEESVAIKEVPLTTDKR